MKWKLPDGNIIGDNEPFTVGDVVYPSVYGLDKEITEQLKITPIIESPLPDPRFYIVSLDPVNSGQWIVTSRDIEVVKKSLIVQIKQHAGQLLDKFDWEVIRGLTGGKILDPEIFKYYNDVRSTSNALEVEIQSCKTIEELASWKPKWPNVPGEQDAGI